MSAFAKYLSCFCRKRPIPEISEIENMNVRVTEHNTDSLCSQTSVNSIDRESCIKNYIYNPN